MFVEEVFPAEWLRKDLPLEQSPVSQREQSTFSPSAGHATTKYNAIFSPSSLWQVLLGLYWHWYLNFAPSAAIQAWAAPVLGDHHRVLYRYILDMKKQTAAYGNILPVIQSSGTGKSRTVHEVASLIFTLPFNVHPQLNTGFGK